MKIELNIVGLIKPDKGFTPTVLTYLTPLIH